MIEITNGGEAKRMDFYSKSCDILLLELSGQMSLDEGSLVATVSRRLLKDYHRLVESHEGRSDHSSSYAKREPIEGREVARQQHAHLSCSAITDKHKLELRDVLGCFSHFLKSLISLDRSQYLSHHKDRGIKLDNG